MPTIYKGYTYTCSEGSLIETSPGGISKTIAQVQPGVAEFLLKAIEALASEEC